MNSGAFGWDLQAAPTDQTTPAVAPNLIVNPNILMIMVDQLRLPQLWLNNTTQQPQFDALCPNIAWLRNASYRFQNFYVAAQACTPSRATLLTGLYAPQTGIFATQFTSAEPDLNPNYNSGLANQPGFPTFGNALQDIAGYDPNNVLWFGKWHVSNKTGLYDYVNGASDGVDTLPFYGFNQGRSSQILWPSYYGSPNGAPNEGSNGYLYDPPNPPVGSLSAAFGACDDSIVNDFVNNWTNHPPTAGKPWFACVSFINPHDMQDYPGFFPPTVIDAGHPTNNPNGMEGTGNQGVPGDYTPNGTQIEPTKAFFQSMFANYTLTPAMFTAPPQNFNYESTQILEGKSWDVSALRQDKANFLQPFFQQDIADAAANFVQGSTELHGPILSELEYSDFLNWYYYLISQVDANIGTVLSTVLGPGYTTNVENNIYANPSQNTAIIFLSDHGEFGGSHGLHAKAGAVYDEALRVPFYVVTPGQNGGVEMFHMCSMVDVFKLVVELALGATHDWQHDPKYLDQYYNANQSIFSFIKAPSTPEIRGFWDNNPLPPRTQPVWYPLILTTADETHLDEIPWARPRMADSDCDLRNHVMCMRTKSDANTMNFESAFSGGKLAIYSKWVLYPPAPGTPGYNSLAPLVDATTNSFVQDYEYYDYLNYNNRTEISYLLNGSQTGSDYLPASKSEDGGGVLGIVPGSGPGANHLLAVMASAFGNMQQTAPSLSPPFQAATGYVSTILTRTLYGALPAPVSTDLYTLTYTGLTNWYAWLQGILPCSS